MRRIALLGVGVLATSSLAVLAGPAYADHGEPECPHGDGTLPGSGSSTIPIGPDDGSKYQTIFIDDRDYLDLDEDNVAGGIWIYIEENEIPGLTRGGNHVAFHDPDGTGPLPAVNPDVPFIPPQQILPPNPGGLPVFPNGLTLFPTGFGGGGLDEAAGERDPCDETDDPATPDVIEGPSAPDAILF